MTGMALQVLSPADGLRRYLMEIKKFPILDQREEQKLARDFRDFGDISAAHRLVTSHLRLVYKIALGFKGYGLPIGDLIAEGNIGLMQAVKKFDPDRGFRLSTYAMWWIKASIQEFVLKSWSLVKFGTSAAQKRLFFNLRKLKNRIMGDNGGVMGPIQVAKIASALNVSSEEVIDMDQRISYGGDQYLNRAIAHDSEDEFQDFLVEPAASQEQQLLERQENGNRRLLFRKAVDSLNDRERDILIQRRLLDKPNTLDEVSKQYDISKERVRQIEAKAFEKVQNFIISSKAA